MATTSLITIENMEDIAIYKHYDGHPQEMLIWLKDFHVDFIDNIGWNPSYELAQVLKSSARDHEKYNGLDNDKYFGWGIVKTKEYSSNYKYVLCKKSIKIYRFEYDIEDYVCVNIESLEEKEEEKKSIQEKLKESIRKYNKGKENE